jgi:hypothetical protein
MDDHTTSVGALVREQEDIFLHGTTQLSKYVHHSPHEVIEKIYAYLNDTFISGPEDSLGRKKPFFNICKAAVNIWFRATDIDRSQIHILATKASDWIDSFLATIKLREWMRKELFGQTLNDWGLNDARFGGSVLKFVENDTGLHCSVVPWSRMIFDAVDFENNPQIEVLELTPAQLKKRVRTMGYDADAVNGLLDDVQDRETIDKLVKDRKSDYIRAYEVHAELEKSLLTGDEADDDIFTQQMWVISMVGKKSGRKVIWNDYVLYAGQEDKSPYERTWLIDVPDRTLPVGAVENTFEAQWQTNHSMKAVRDTMDLSSKIILQSPDPQFLNMNVLESMETGDILTYASTKGPLARVQTEAPQLNSELSYAAGWKQLSNEINGISDAMLGIAPKSGTAWRQTQAILQENYSLFEVMTENRGLHLERIIRTRIIPWIKKHELDNADEISAILSAQEIDKIDSTYMKREAVRRYNDRTINQLLKNADAVSKGKPASPIAPFNPNGEMEALKQEMAQLGNTRFFKPGDLDDHTWAVQLKDLEWEVEVDITGESYDTKAVFDVLNLALKMMMTPGFDQNPKAQAVVKRVFELSGVFSPMEYDSLPAPTPPPVAPPVVAQPSPQGNLPAPAAAPPAPQMVAAG